MLKILPRMLCSQILSLILHFCFLVLLMIGIVSASYSCGPEEGDIRSPCFALWSGRKVYFFSFLFDIAIQSDLVR